MSSEDKHPPDASLERQIKNGPMPRLGIDNRHQAILHQSQAIFPPTESLSIS